MFENMKKNVYTMMIIWLLLLFFAFCYNYLQILRMTKNLSRAFGVPIGSELLEIIFSMFENTKKKVYTSAIIMMFAFCFAFCYQLIQLPTE